MPYTPTEWKNREVERPRTFKIQNNSDDTVTLLPAEGNIIEPGTPIIADNMNKIEQGIADAQAALEDVAPKEHTHDASAITSGTIAAARLPSATTGAKGIVQLSDSLYNTSTQQAATANAVKQVYDEMMLVKQSVVDGKGQLADVINGKGGGPVSANNTFPELAAGINRISTGGYLSMDRVKDEYRSSNYVTLVDILKMPPARSFSFIADYGAGYPSASLEAAYGRNGDTSCSILLRDSTGVSVKIREATSNSWSMEETVCIYSIRGDMTKTSNQLLVAHIIPGGAYKFDNISLPSNFNRTGPLTVTIRYARAELDPWSGYVGSSFSGVWLWA